MFIIYRKSDGEIVEVFKDETGKHLRNVTVNGLNSELAFAEVEDSEATNANDCALVKTVFTRLEIVRSLKALGELSKLTAFLGSNAEFKLLWDCATEIDLNDPDTKTALESIDIDIDAVKRKIAEM